MGFDEHQIYRRTVRNGQRRRSRCASNGAFTQQAEFFGRRRSDPVFFGASVPDPNAARQTHRGEQAMFCGRPMPAISNG
jgi:hypothetical protein